MSILDSDAFNDALFFPREDASPPPDGARDQFVERDGARIHIRRYPANGGRCTLLLFHGNGELAADYDDAWPQYEAFGAALAVAEFRGYGQATGAPTLRAVIEDAAAIAEAVAVDGDGGPVIVMGRSLGGAAAHELYARPPAGVIGVVLESAFSHLGDLIRRRGLRPPAVFREAELATFDPLRKIARGRLPLLVLHGGDDELVVPAEARAAYEAASSAASRELVFVPGRGHNDLMRGEVYWEALAAFVERVVGA